MSPTGCGMRANNEARYKSRNEFQVSVEADKAHRLFAARTLDKKNTSVMVTSWKSSFFKSQTFELPVLSIRKDKTDKLLDSRPMLLLTDEKSHGLSLSTTGSQKEASLTLTLGEDAPLTEDELKCAAILKCCTEEEFSNLPLLIQTWLQTADPSLKNAVQTMSMSLHIDKKLDYLHGTPKESFWTLLWYSAESKERKDTAWDQWNSNSICVDLANKMMEHYEWKRGSKEVWDFLKEGVAVRFTYEEIPVIDPDADYFSSVERVGNLKDVIDNLKSKLSEISKEMKIKISPSSRISKVVGKNKTSEFMELTSSLDEASSEYDMLVSLIASWEETEGFKSREANRNRVADATEKANKVAEEYCNLVVSQYKRDAALASELKRIYWSVIDECTNIFYKGQHSDRNFRYPSDEEMDVWKERRTRELKDQSPVIKGYDKGADGSTLINISEKWNKQLVEEREEANKMFIAKCAEEKKKQYDAEIATFKSSPLYVDISQMSTAEAEHALKDRDTKNYRAVFGISRPRTSYNNY